MNLLELQLMREQPPTTNHPTEPGPLPRQTTMTNYHELPDIEREILKVLLNSEDYTATTTEISEKTYYPNADVFYSVSAMYEAGFLQPVYSVATPTRAWTPSPDMLTHLLELRRVASAELRNAARDVLEQIKRFEEGEEHGD